MACISSTSKGLGTAPPVFDGILEADTGVFPSILPGTAEAPEWLIWIATAAPCLCNLSVNLNKFGIYLSWSNLIWVVPFDPKGKSTQAFSTIIRPVPPSALFS